MNLIHVRLCPVAWSIKGRLRIIDLIADYGRFSAAASFIALSAYLIYSLILATGCAYNIFGSVEAKVTG